MRVGSTETLVIADWVICMTAEYQFSYHQSPALTDIEQLWQTLAAQSEQSFFLQWPWIGTWLKTFAPKQYYLVVARYAEQVVGLAILVEHVEWRYGVIRSKQLCLHRTGIATSDEIWIEYNDFLLAKGHASQLRSQMFRYICDTLAFDELLFGASDAGLLAELAQQTELTRTDVWFAKAYCVQFHDAPTQGFDSYLSANSRYQIKRSLKLYPGYQFEKASDSHQAMAWLQDIIELHQQRWSVSGFRQSSFSEFHQQLLNDGIACGQVELLKVTLDDTTRVYLYNFIWANKVYFYLSAIAEPSTTNVSNNKAKPGLVAHYLAIEYYKSKGFLAYDFMGGDARYKASFSNEISELYISKFQRNKLIFLLEQRLKNAKNKLRNSHDQT